MYDPRTQRDRETISKNVYLGTRYEDSVGGIFHSEGTKYSNAFRTITSPLGYSMKPTPAAAGNDIISFGNIVTNGGGYPDKVDLMATYITTRSEDMRPDLYIQNGKINEDRVQVQQNKIPTYSNYLFNQQLNNNSVSTIPEVGKLYDNAAKKDRAWSGLYNDNHTAKSPIDTDGYTYGNTNIRSEFSIRDEPPNRSGLSRKAFFNTGNAEPYIVSEIPGGHSRKVDIGTDRTDNGRITNMGGKSIPLQRPFTDVNRISNYITSHAGIYFLARQNLHLLIPTNVQKNGVRLLMMVISTPVKHMN